MSWGPKILHIIHSPELFITTERHPARIPDVKDPDGMVAADFRMWYIRVESGGSRMEWRRQLGVKWRRQPDGIPSRVECAGSHTPCIMDLLMDSKEPSSISDCFGDQKAIKTPNLNTIWLELIARVLNMLIGLKGNNYWLLLKKCYLIAYN